MELLDKGNLVEQKDKNPFSVRETEVTTYQVLDALSYVHSFDIVHHDVKSLNVLVRNSWFPASSIVIPVSIACIFMS